MRVLVGCEYSGVVSQAFRAKGHSVMSCDWLPSDVPGEHYVGDVFDVINKGFDLAVFHPPCTYLCNAGLHLCRGNKERSWKQLQAIDFVHRLYNCSIPMVAIENPKGILSTIWQPASQIIYPSMFGSVYRKDICLWLKNLPPLISTCYNTKRKSISNHVNSRMSQEQKSKIKSRFFPEVAAAMANQWS